MHRGIERRERRFDELEPVDDTGRLLANHRAAVSTRGHGRIGRHVAAPDVLLERGADQPRDEVAIESGCALVLQER